MYMYTRSSGRIIRMPNVRQYTRGWSIPLIYYRGNVALSRRSTARSLKPSSLLLLPQSLLRSAPRKAFELLCAYSPCISLSVTLDMLRCDVTLSVMFASRTCCAHYGNVSGVFPESTKDHHPAPIISTLNLETSTKAWTFASLSILFSCDCIIEKCVILI